MISCIEWVPKGVADPTPKKYELSPAEMELLEKQAEFEAGVDDDDEDDVPSTTKSSIQLPEIDPSTLPPDLRMDEYSDTEDNEAYQGSALGRLLVGREGEAMMGTHLDEEGKPVFDDDDDDDEQDEDGVVDDEDINDVAVSDGIVGNDSDSDSDDDLADVPDTREFVPTDVAGLEAMGISHGGGGGDEEEDENIDDDASDIDDTRISPDDAIVVVAKTEDDFAALEVHIYEEKSGNLFVHHDIPLPSFPLCMAQGDINANGAAGNYIAVGTFSPGIEVWNLDVLNVLEPSFVLGGNDTSGADELMKHNMMRAASGKKMKKGWSQQNSGLVEQSHTDAVMALSWNKIHRQVLASGSADTTVKLWDVTKANSSSGANAVTFTHHKGKVQAVEWHPSDGTLLATGSYDRTVALVDARSANEKSKKVKISADIESLAWDPHHSEYLTAATEDGVLSCWDVRKFEKPVWSFVADEFCGVTDFSYNTNVPGMLATCSTNKNVTLWDAYSNGKPSLQAPLKCGNKSMEVGKLYTVSFYQSSPWLMGCGGSGNELALWDMTREESIQKRFASRLTNTTSSASISVEQEEEPSSSKEQDFEAIMSTADNSMKEERAKAANKSNQKKGKKKKKTHRKGR